MRPMLSVLVVAIALSAPARPAPGQVEPPARDAPNTAQAGRIASGPSAGAALTRVEVFAASGPRAGTTFDAAAQLGTAPCALLFVQELTRNTAPMIRALDRLGIEYGLLGFRSFTILLADDRTAAEKQIERSSNALSLRNPIAVSLDGTDGPGAYGLNRKCTLTLVLGKDAKVTRAIGFTDTGAQDVPQMEAWIAELTGPMPKDRASLRALLAQRYPGTDPDLLDLTAGLLLQARRAEQDGPRMRERGAAPAGARQADAKAREGGPPEDEELRALLRAAIQKSATDADLDDVFAKVDARVGSDAALRLQAVEMFRLLVSLGYGTESAQTRAKRYVAEHGGSPTPTGDQGGKR